jgi:hypothetical protein
MPVAESILRRFIMKMLQATHHTPEPPARNSWHVPRQYGWLLVFVSIIAIAVFSLRNQDFSRLNFPSTLRPGIWWQGVHVHADGREMPRLQLSRITHSQLSGVLETSFSSGFHIRLPVQHAILSETDVIFAVDDPHSFSQPRAQEWYVLHKTGATTSTLYRLNLGYHSPAVGMMIPTNLDKQHHRVANMTTGQSASTNR